MANTGNNPYEVELLTTQYTTLLELLLQQKTSKLRDAVSTGVHVGKMASPVQQIGVLSVRAPAGRYSSITFDIPNYTRRWVFPTDRELAVPLDTFDELRTIVDPKAAINGTVESAYNRFFDDLIITAFNASASTGVDASSLTTETFDTTNARVASDYNAGAATGISYPKLTEAWRIMRHYQVDLDAEPPMFIAGSRQEDELKRLLEVANRDYNPSGAVQSGTIPRLAGFNIMISERLPVASNVRTCFAWVKSGMYLGIWRDMNVKISNRDDLSSQPWQLYSMATAGATRLQQFKVIEVLCSDTTGADPTAP